MTSKRIMANSFNASTGFLWVTSNFLSNLPVATASLCRLDQNVLFLYSSITPRYSTDRPVRSCLTMAEMLY